VRRLEESPGEWRESRRELWFFFLPLLGKHGLKGGAKAPRKICPRPSAKNLNERIRKRTGNLVPLALFPGVGNTPFGDCF